MSTLQLISCRSCGKTFLTRESFDGHLTRRDTHNCRKQDLRWVDRDEVLG